MVVQPRGGVNTVVSGMIYLYSTHVGRVTVMTLVVDIETTEKTIKRESESR